MKFNKDVINPNEPESWLWLNGITTVMWFLQFPLVYAWQRNLQRSVPYLVGISIAAAALGQLAAWQAARVECRMKNNLEGGGTINN